MANWYVSSVAYAALTAWSAGATLSVGAYRKPTAPTAGNERVYRVSSITTGITGGTEPTWPLNANQTVVDGGVTWTECTGQEAYAPTAAAPHVDVIFVQSNGRGATDGSDWVFVDSNHTEPTWTSSRDWSRAGKTRVVTWAGMSIPPIPSDMAAGPVVLQTSGSANIAVAGAPDFDGFEFRCGSGSSQAHFHIGRLALTGIAVIRNGKIKLNNTASGSRIWIGNSSAGSIVLDNTPTEWGHASQQFTMNIAGGFLVWVNTPNAVQGTVPTALFFSNFAGANTLIENCDLSGVTGTILTAPSGSLTWYGTFRVVNCKLHASVIRASNWRLRSAADILEFVGCDDGTSNKISEINRATMAGEIITRYEEYRDNAAAGLEGSKFSLRAVHTTAANGSPTRGFHNILHVQTRWNDTVGSPITAEVEVAVEHSALLSRASMWLEAVYMGDSASPKGSVESGMTNDAPAGTPTAGTASTENWTATARTNSENPAIGSIRSVSSNAGRLFVKESGGALNGSLPSGYATMVDGDTITDGAATMRAMYRQTLSVTFTPNRIGPISFRVHIHHPASTPKVVLVDPNVTLS